MADNTPNPNPNNVIRGPRSALTDYLASQNISAHSINSSVRARRAAANAASDEAAQASGVQNENEDENEEGDEATTSASARQARSLKRKKQAQAIERIKESKAYKRYKPHLPSDEEEQDDFALSLLESKEPLPGQIENCEECQKRFTVTAYTRKGPNGGLLCPKCGKLADDKKAPKKGKKKVGAGPAGGKGRRKHMSQLLDGQVGVKSLLALCVETVANNISLAEDLGHSSPEVVDRIARQLSKRRLLNSHTLNLFLQPEAEDMRVYDAALLASADYERILQICSNLKTLKLRNAIQFRDNTMEYLISRHIVLEDLYLHGSNLITEACWERYLMNKGDGLKALRVYYTDKHFSDKIIRSLPKYCPSLTRLKVCHNQEVSDQGVRYIANLKHLKHLGLQLIKQTSTASYVHVVKSIGKQLNTFSVRMIPDVDDRLLQALHEHCISLTKLRITHSEFMTDEGFVNLFTGWKNTPLKYIDLELCRWVDATEPRENKGLVGLCSNGFQAMMNHSGKRLKKLSVHGCRHITREAFESVFSSDSEYPELVDMEISFCEEVTDLVVGSIFRCCPKLKKLNVFGCMKVRDVRVPRGRILVGVPNAIGMVIEGTED
ncbi:RNI-like protein [Hypoxylon sp. FL1284]|nr:RNI-like protein [Hypoxylon sp. FL1284]